MGRTLTRMLVGGLLLAGGGYALLQAGGTHADSLPCQPPNRGFDFDTYEIENYQQQYATAIELAAAGKGLPAPYTLSTGETIDVQYQGLETGPRTARLPENRSLQIPPTIFKSIVWIESNWANGAGTVPYGGVGPLLISGDCGYGLGQITSGMGHLGGDAKEPGVPSARQAIIGTHFLFNLAEGARILAGKWNSAPSARPIAGLGDPSMLEDWYFAIWSYNGFAFSNHPLNPSRDPLRGGGTASPVYHCGDPAAPGYQPLPGSGLKYNYGDYTYPERVYGCMRYPPRLSGTVSAAAVESGQPKFAIGDPAIVVGTGDCLVVHTAPGTAAPRIVPAPGGCIPDGTPVTITGGPQVSGAYTWWQAQTPIGPGWMAENFLAKEVAPAPVDPANRMWLPQVFDMPHLAVEAVANAFRPQNYLTCTEADDLLGGCPGMDFPTTIPGAVPPITPHHDSTPPVAEAAAAGFVGDPYLQYSGPSKVTLEARSDGSATSTTITVKNTGKGIAPFRVRTSASWLVARHPGDVADRSVDGGVAIGSDLEVVTQGARGTQPRVSQKGYQSVLVVTLDAALVPAGGSTGKLWIEPLLGGGTTFELAVTATKAAAPASVTPTTAPPVHFRVVAPGVSGDR